ncbi:MAG: hypothetical protein COA78_24830 [Blastopirellula sp.]|nr:MAG: hypothetical protein COA78_24830 [Blastopirellula sp.]
MVEKFIELDCDFFQKPKFLRLVEISKSSPEEAFYRLYQMWGYALEKSKQGKLKGIGWRSLMTMFGGNERFWKALFSKEVGWLNEGKEGLEIPDWEERFCRKGRQITAFFLQIDINLNRKQAFQLLLDLSDASEADGFCRLFRFWSYAYLESRKKKLTDGFLKSFRPKTLARMFGGDSQFYESLAHESIAWLDVLEDGIQITDWKRRFTSKGCQDRRDARNQQTRRKEKEKSARSKPRQSPVGAQCEPSVIPVSTRSEPGCNSTIDNRYNTLEARSNTSEPKSNSMVSCFSASKPTTAVLPAVVKKRKATNQKWVPLKSLLPRVERWLKAMRYDLDDCDVVYKIAALDFFGQISEDAIQQSLDHFRVHDGLTKVRTADRPGWFFHDISDRMNLTHEGLLDRFSSIFITCPGGVPKVPPSKLRGYQLKVQSKKPKQKPVGEVASMKSLLVDRFKGAGKG